MSGVRHGRSPKRKIMPQKILDVLMLGHCSHEFSWPRRATDGDYYQVCLLCAAEYKYDWNTMRRTERLEHAAAENAVGRGRSHTKKPSWVPRARRLKLDIPLRYRVKNLGTWSEGTIENISQSGSAGERFGRDGFRNAGRDLGSEEQQCALPGKSNTIEECQ